EGEAITVVLIQRLRPEEAVSTRHRVGLAVQVLPDHGGAASDGDVHRPEVEVLDQDRNVFGIRRLCAKQQHEGSDKQLHLLLLKPGCCRSAPAAWPASPW